MFDRMNWQIELEGKPEVYRKSLQLFQILGFVASDRHVILFLSYWLNQLSVAWNGYAQAFTTWHAFSQVWKLQVEPVAVI